MMNSFAKALAAALLLVVGACDIPAAPPTPAPQPAPAPTPAPAPAPTPAPVPAPQPAKPFSVGPASFATLQEAHDASPAPVVVHVVAGLYDNGQCSLHVNKPTQVVGAGDGRDGKPATHCVGGAIEGKALMVADADLSLADLLLTDITVPDQNGAPVRQQKGVNVTVERSTIERAENGFLGGSGGTIVFRDTFVRQAGRDGYQHGLYVGRSTKLLVEGGTYTDTRGGGHHVKSRAAETVLDGVVLGRPDGAGDESRSVDLPNGGNVTIRNATIYKGAQSGENQHDVIAWGAEGDLQPGRTVLVENTRIVSSDPGAVLFNNNYTTLADVTFKNVRFEGVWHYRAAGPHRCIGCVVNGQPVADYVFPEAAPAPAPTPAPQPTPVPAPTPAPQPVSGALADIIAAMPAGSWREVATTNKIRDVYPPGQWADGVVYAWSGAGWGAGHLVVIGGGHNDYGGNEVYALDLTTLTWRRVTDPSPYANWPACYDAPPCQTTDGTPTSVHTYDGIQYVPATNEFWVGGGSPYQAVGSFTNQAFSFNWGTKTWKRRAPVPVGTALASDTDPATGWILVAAQDRLWVYDPVRDTVVGRTGASWGARDLSGAWSPRHRIFVLLIDPSEKGGRVMRWDFTGRELTNIGDRGNDLQATYRGTDPVTGERARFLPPWYNKAGIVYWDKLQRFVFWGGNKDVWYLDPTTWEWRGDDPPTGPATATKTAGIYGRWACLPEYDACLGYNDPAGNLWVYKPLAGL